MMIWPSSPLGVPRAHRFDHNETRSWHGWHRHVSLVMLAFAMMAVIRHQANADQHPKKHRHAGTPNSVRDPLVIQEIRRIAIKLAQQRISIDRVLAWSLLSLCERSIRAERYAHQAPKSGRSQAARRYRNRNRDRPNHAL
jgi:hypothetical protein